MGDEATADPPEPEANRSPPIAIWMNAKRDDEAPWSDVGCRRCCGDMTDQQVIVTINF